MTTQTLERPILSVTPQRTYTCVERIYAGTAIEPAEYCDREVAEEEAFCEDHGGDALEEAQERAHTAWKENL